MSVIKCPGKDGRKNDEHKLCPLKQLVVKSCANKKENNERKLKFQIFNAYFFHKLKQE